MESKADQIRHIICTVCSEEKIRKSLELLRDGSVTISGSELNTIVNKEIKPSNPMLGLDDVKKALLKERVFVLDPLKEDSIVIAQYNPYLDQLSLYSMMSILQYRAHYNKIRTAVRDILIYKINKLTETQFVNLVYNVLSFEKIVWIKEFRLSTRVSRDGGRDFFATIKITASDEMSDDEFGKDVPVVGQIKHVRSKVGSPMVQQFIGSMDTYNRRAKYGLIIGTNGFSSDALDAIDKSSFKVFHRDANWLIDLMIKYSIGVKAITLKGYSIDDLFWHEISH
jgi:hypothetical protein